MRIEAEFDATQRQVVIDIARLIYRSHGAELPADDPLYLWRSQHPKEQAVRYTAEKIFEMFWGDEPDYEDDAKSVSDQAMKLELGSWDTR